LKLLISASVLGSIFYYAYNYINSVKPINEDLNIIDKKLINVDPIVIHNAAKSIPIEDKKSFWEFVITELIHINPIVIGGGAVFIAGFLVYWIPKIFLKSTDIKLNEVDITQLNKVFDSRELAELEILKRTERLAHIEKSISVSTVEQCKEASLISTSLFFERVIPSSNFEFFINKVDFSVLSYKNIFEYYKIIPRSERDIFIHAYTTHSRSISIYNASSVYIASRAFLNNPDTNNILRLYNSPQFHRYSLVETIQGITRLSDLEKLIHTSTAKLLKEASTISTHLLMEFRIPSSDFEFFINRVDFSLLKSEKIWWYYKTLPTYERDLFIYAYNKYVKAQSAINTSNTSNTSNSLLSKLYDKLHIKQLNNLIVNLFSPIFNKMITEKSTKPIKIDFLNLTNTSAIPRSNQLEILKKIKELEDLEITMPTWTNEELSKASEISTSLVLELRLPNSNFEFFINRVNFSLLTDKNIFEFSRIVPSDQLDVFTHAYEKYKRS